MLNGTPAQDRPFSAITDFGVFLETLGCARGIVISMDVGIFGGVRGTVDIWGEFWVSGEGGITDAETASDAICGVCWRTVVVWRQV